MRDRIVIFLVAIVIGSCATILIRETEKGDISTQVGKDISQDEGPEEGAVSLEDLLLLIQDLQTQLLVLQESHQSQVLEGVPVPDDDSDSDS